MTVSLGMPAGPPPVLAERRHTRKITLRHPHHPVEVGGDAPISVQSMTTTVTADVNATLQQIAELTTAGCQVVRVAVPSQDDAEALPLIAKKADIPVIADIHFQPGTSSLPSTLLRRCPCEPWQYQGFFDDRVGEIAKAKDAGILIRIGVNAYCWTSACSRSTARPRRGSGREALWCPRSRSTISGTSRSP